MHYVVIIYTDVSQTLLKDGNLQACHENFIMVFFKENPKTTSYQTMLLNISNVAIASSKKAVL